MICRTFGLPKVQALRNTAYFQRSTARRLVLHQRYLSGRLALVKRLTGVASKRTPMHNAYKRRDSRPKTQPLKPFRCRRHHCTVGALTAEQDTQLNRFIDMLLEQNKVMNLTGTSLPGHATHLPVKDIGS